MKLKDGNTVGIDLGTSYSTISQLNESGNPLVINSSRDEPVTASVIQLGPGKQVFIGPTTEMMKADPEGTVVAVKRQMGNSEFFKVFQNKALTAELLSAMILRKLKQDAEKRIGPIVNAVITVPYYFSDPCRRATVNAGKIAGLNVIDIINEPTAATLAYAWSQGHLGRQDSTDSEKTMLVYDLGGGTFDVTLVKCTPTQFTVEATDGDTFLGGLDWTRRLVDHAAELFLNDHGIDPREDPLALLTLTELCENAKRELSTSLRAVFSFSHQGKSSAISLTTSEMQHLTADLLQRTRDTTEIVLELSGTRPGDLSEVLLIGGSTNLPGIPEMLQDVCGAKITARLNPQTAVAQGAAIHAAIVEARETGGRGEMSEAIIRRLQSITMSDVNSHSLGVEISDPNNQTGKKNHIMIPRNTRLPFTYRKRFVTDVPNPQSITIRLLEGEASDPQACTYIGDFRISNLPANLPAGSPVEVTYRYDSSGQIKVAARELTGNNKASVEIVRDSDRNRDAHELFRALTEEYQIV